MKKNLTLVLILLILITLIVIITTLTNESANSTAIKTDIPKKFEVIKNKPVAIPKVLPKPKQVIEVKEQNFITKEDLAKIIPAVDKIDFIGKSNSLVELEAQSDIEKILEEQKKLDTFSNKIHPTSKKEGWGVDYGIGLEDGAIENIKNDPSLKPKMLNGKIGFSKSF